MAPLMDDRKSASNGAELMTDRTSYKPRFLIVGAGSRGTAYAAAIVRSDLGIVAAVAEPIPFKRKLLGSSYVWPHTCPQFHQEFEDWKDFVSYEQSRRKDASAADTITPPGVDGVFVCIRDELHCQVVTALAPLGLHIMCEKPLATTLSDCLSIQRTLSRYPQRIFAIGHVLRYSPHNMLLRHLLLERDVLSMEHTEPVGWWHFSHSYVRGQWRKESTSAPSLLTKSCHDIDFILWLLCSPPPDGDPHMPHLPAKISSTGSLKQFRRSRKPAAAGKATNCLSCPLQKSCMYSAPRIYNDRHLAKCITKWPVDIVNPEIPSILSSSGPEAAKAALMGSLAEDYDSASTPIADIESRPWFGRCVWESDNDVCDDQIVTFTWDDDEANGKGAKTAVFHMIAQSLAQCQRRGRIYGTTGEIEYDSKQITVHDFITGESEVHNPEVPMNSHHGGGDDGLAAMFAQAVAAVESGNMGVKDAQRDFLGCTVEEMIRSHAAVFAAEMARKENRVVGLDEW
ncbi:hypothetical protein LTR91_007980 [Friedmanniomyces endolithicus]|uniref:Gfo/Idh/MocA-like oxidoreductase N-terminal domain-containing protein n=1 Tax=Friedmanniomyces endolithicus TaxID=329885 RepID=A0AAN6KNU3_9PEZI|nr:hypothetical protein LTR82_014039 [Friedmanniomyces endolithicus]KAK0993625.1 hypothetical protein LTR91_007980 [Friedmanniomyces endolithicus]KAK1000849.1 hypothetical protein LTS01_004856 [Friedmanniomyces endolithicus]KAK1049204.1 hypothetical protein LTS16_003906 [Friedmanniomyces endolithicus]